jgi:glycosyltransferase involved in cell wall biosynthesis
MTADAVGGVWTYALDLSAALAQHDINVVLATMGPRPNAAQRAAVRRLSHVQLVESDYRLEWMTDPWRDVSAAGEWLLDVAHDAAVDVIHLNGYSHAALPWRRPVVCVAHSCVVSWWHAVHREQPPAEWDIYRGNVTLGLNSADLVVAPTAAFLETLQSCYGFKRPARVIRNGRPQNHSSAPAALGRSGGGREPTLLGCGRLWDAAKNLSVFDAAAEGLPWAAYVIGDPFGPDGQTFVPKAVNALGTMSHHQVQSWLQRASIFVHPALYEPFGLAVLEAAAAGCALVLSDIPTLRELWDGAAEFFNPCDSAQLHAALNLLITDSTKRAALAAAAQRRAAEYGVDSMAAAYAKVYRSLAASVPRTGKSSGARAVA